MKKMNLKKALGVVSATMVITNAVPTMAATRVTDISSINMVNSGIGDMIIDQTDNINVDGSNVSVVKSSEINIVNSYIQTLLDSGVTNINLRGKNIEITNLDATNISDSTVVTVLKQKAKTIKTKELVNKYRYR